MSREIINMKDFVSAALLAGGNSSRMGFDKQYFHIYKERLFKNILPVLCSLFDDVMVVTGQPELYIKMNVRIINDIIPGYGPLSGIHAAVKESKSRYVYIIACDMPVINIDYIKYMMDILSSNSADACLAIKGDWIEPFHAFYGKNCLSMMEADLLDNNATIHYVLQKLNTYYIPEPEARRFSPDWSLFRNLNTPEDLEAWKS